MGYRLTALPGGVTSARFAVAMTLSLGVHAGAALWVDGWLPATVHRSAAHSVQVRLIDAAARETLAAVAPDRILMDAAAPSLHGVPAGAQALTAVRLATLSLAAPPLATQALPDATPVTARHAAAPARTAAARPASVPAPVAPDSADVPAPARAAAPPQRSTAAVTPESDPAAHSSAASTASAVADTPPRAMAGNAPPQYPWAARRLGQQGQVLLRLQVLPDGSTSALAVVRSSGVASLDRAARSAVSRWRFTPASSGGRAVAATVEVPVVFRLDERG
jgi:protein TonB